jgi:hypothetical protein
MVRYGYGVDELKFADAFRVMAAGVREVRGFRRYLRHQRLLLRSKTG